MCKQIVVAATEGGAICGGYNPAGWIGLGEDRDSIAAFLFTWPDGNTSKRPIKLEKVDNQCLGTFNLLHMQVLEGSMKGILC